MLKYRLNFSRLSFFMLSLILLSCMHRKSSDSTSSSVDADEQLSYGQLAEVRIGPAYQQILESLKSLTPRTRPEEAKTLRKNLGQVRQYFDLFAFAYPNDKDQDVWVELRNDLDEGYEQIGFFKDLYDIQNLAPGETPKYDEEELKKSRETCLKWNDKFQKHQKQFNYQDYIDHPSYTEIFLRKGDALSKFYWGEVKTRPDANLNGMANLRNLVRELLKLASDDFNTVIELKDLLDHNEVETFHDFRKRIRSMTSAIQLFPTIVSSNPRSTEILTQLIALVETYGSIHDLIISYEKAKDKNNDKKAKKIAEEIDEAWSKSKKEQKNSRIDRVLKEYRDFIKAD